MKWYALHRLHIIPGTWEKLGIKYHTLNGIQQKSTATNFMIEWPQIETRNVKFRTLNGFIRLTNSFLYRLELKYKTKWKVLELYCCKVTAACTSSVKSVKDIFKQEGILNYERNMFDLFNRCVTLQKIMLPRSGYFTLPWNLLR